MVTALDDRGAHATLLIHAIHAIAYQSTTNTLATNQLTTMDHATETDGMAVAELSAIVVFCLSAR
jgi:hypothetical protein